MFPGLSKKTVVFLEYAHSSDIEAWSLMCLNMLLPNSTHAKLTAMIPNLRRTVCRGHVQLRGSPVKLRHWRATVKVRMPDCEVTHNLFASRG